MNHAVSELVCLLKNGQLARKNKVVLSFSKMKQSILEILKKEGYIKDFEIVRFSFTNNKGIDYFECIYHEEKMFLSDTEIREIWSSKFRELNKDFFDNLEKDNKHE